ncbi:MAG: class I SAM-dependent methyltransferase [Candidatus Aenigmarchaeota archaeon]|nr:class I SAM-dependent methyltransferase [Candidatus Aenigmarchaeota archaeon]
MSKLYMFASRLYRHGLNRFSFLRKKRFEHTYKKRKGFGSLEYHKQIAQDIVKNIPHKQYRSALDLGCGYGFITAKLAVTIPSVTAIDISATALNVAMQNNKKVRFLHHDVINYCRGKYDLILCVGILPYIPENYVSQVAKNIDKMLVDNGSLVIFEKVGYTGTRIEKYLKELPYTTLRRRIRIAGMPFLLIVAKKSAGHK